MSRRRYRCRGREYEVEARFRDGRLVFTSPDGEERELHARPVGDGEWLVREADGRSRRLAVAHRRGTWWVHWGRRTWVLEEVTRGPAPSTPRAR